MAGNCSGGVGSAVATGASASAPVAVGDFTGDQLPDLLDKHLEGSLWLLTGNGRGDFGPETSDGNGWATFGLTGVGDANGDGAADVLARTSSGTSLLYEGTGTSGWKTVDGGVPLTTPLPASVYPNVFGVGDLTGDGNPDVEAPQLPLRLG